MDEMWRESDDSDDECSQAESQVNPRQESGDEPEPEDSSSQEGNDQIVSYEPEPEDSEGNDLRRCLMLISAKATHEKVSEQELHDLLGSAIVRPRKKEIGSVPPPAARCAGVIRELEHDGSFAESLEWIQRIHCFANAADVDVLQGAFASGCVPNGSTLG
eukprot:743411-Rhodomonas_salina.1